MYAASWSHYEKQAVIEFEEEMYDFAEENFERAIRHNPEAYKSYAYLGHLALQRKDQKNALTFYEKSLSINNNQPEIHYLAGSIYDYLLQYSKAFDHLKTAVQQNPEHLMAHIGLSRLYSLEKKYDLSNSHFAQAYQLGKQKSEKLFREARAMREAKKDNSALLLLRRAREANPAHSECYFEASSILRGEKRYKEAIGTLEKLLYYRPHEEKAWVHIANIYYSQRVLKNKMRDFTAAIYYINKALELSPDDIRYLELLEDCYLKTGDRENYLKVHKKIERRLEEGSY